MDGRELGFREPPSKQPQWRLISVIDEDLTLSYSRLFTFNVGDETDELLHRETRYCIDEQTHTHIHTLVHKKSP